MKNLSLLAILTLSLLVVMVTMPVGLNAQSSTTQHGAHFVDADGDGYNDNAPDADGDGIPNGQDPDYVRPGSGRGATRGFVDTDGDGFNDNAPDADGDGIPNGQDPDYKRPADGSGQKYLYGHRNRMRTGDGQPKTPGDCTGNCEGTPRGPRASGK